MGTEKRGMGRGILVVPIFVVLTALLLWPDFRWVPRAKTIACMDRTRQALSEYGKEYEELPHGTPAELIRILTARNQDSQNSRKIVFLKRLNEMELDEQGRLLDGWHHPLVFMRVNDRDIAIKSLGKNGIDNGSEKDDIVWVVTAQKKEVRNEKK
jgi:hypothetical protein